MTLPLLYFDTSAIVPAFVREPATERVQALMASREGEGLAISPWVQTEFSSALALKVGIGEIDADVFVAALGEWGIFIESVNVLPVGEAAFREAALICQRHESGLRAGDALHLAVAAANDCTLATLDERMAAAAEQLGVAVAEI